MSRHRLSSLEILEARIAPAGAFTTFVDADGDTVKISSTKGALADLTGALSIVANHLDSVNLGSAFNGASISITVTALGTHSDGLVDVGSFSSTVPLASVVIKGNLGKINTLGIGSLTLDALGGRGDTTGAADFNSTIGGDLGTLKIFKNLDQSYLQILGTLKTATIGGSLVGGQAENSGRLDVFKTSGTITVGGSLSGNVGAGSGSINLFQSFIAGPQKCGTVIIDGSIQGGAGPGSGALSGVNFDSIFVGGSVFGNSTSGTGHIFAFSVSKSLTVSGSLNGNTGSLSGSIQIEGTSTSNGTLTIGGNVFGVGPKAGYIHVAGKLKSATIMGSLTGGIDTESGSLLLAQTDTVFIGGDVQGGGTQTRAGVVEITGLSKTITIGGSLIGGFSADSGRLRFVYANTLKIGGNVTGDVAMDTGSIFGSVVGSVIIGGDVENVGIGFGSSDTPATTKMVAKSIAVGGSVSGAYFEFGAKTRSDLQVGSLTVNGDWNESDLIVGALNTGADNTLGTGNDDNLNFGDSHDILAPHDSSALPTINSIAIEGTIRGEGSNVHYGFVAGKIGAFRAGSVNVLLTPGASNDLREIGGTNVTIHEIDGTNQVANPTAPANIVTFTDTDGDLVKVTSSKGTGAQLTAAMTLSNGQLQKLDLTQAKTSAGAFVFAGANISISVLQLGDHGNGTVDVGVIDATGLKLGNVLVKGDLAKILAGTDTTKPAIGTLTANSLGARDTTSGAPNIQSEITGNAGALRIFGDVHGELKVFGKLASITVLGDLAGGTTVNAGSIQVDNNVGAVFVGGSLEGDALGTGSLILAQLDTNTVGAITIGGSLKGSSKIETALISASKVASLTIGGSISGSNNSGQVSFSSVGNLTIGGSIFGTGFFSGFVEVTDKSGIVKIGGSITGGGSETSGAVHFFGKYTSVTVQGDITGGTANDAGDLRVGDGGAIFVGGRVSGASGASVGTDGGITGGKVGAVTINGSLLAADHGVGGTLRVDSAPAVKVLGSVANYQPASGNIRATLSLGTLDVSGDVNGALVLIGNADAKGGSTVTKAVHVGGSVLLSTFSFGSFAREDVAVGTFTVDGNWTSSNLLVGTANTGGSGNANFGDANDVFAATRTTPKVGAIASIIIEGRIGGTAAVNTDHFGFVAGEIKAFRAGSVKLALTPGAGNDGGLELGIAGDLTVKELS